MPRQPHKNHGRAAVIGASYFRHAGGKPKQKTNRKDNDMMISQQELKRALDALEPWKELDVRKLSNGKLARFVDWKRKAGKEVR